MSILAAPIARICLVILFPFSALDKIFNWDGALKQANSGILPGGPVLLVLAMSCEIVTPLLIVGGWYDRLAAFVLAGYCVVTALLYHDFWAYGDFWASGESKARSHFWDFLKNFGLVGGLLAVVLGAPLASVGFVLSHPLSSTGVYEGVAPGAVDANKD
ncbi:DoxX family protein [Beijerinckia sp. L45]|uniref:DoxX family protein n=1 Tax=Beijerinckia sp. L45 TaxID=1641855 RepID=UPI00131A9D52|nr:DoxX family protein [Beijerinckia sp. L45]